MKTVAIILMMMVFSPISACTDSDVENTRLKIEDKPFLTQDPTTLESLSDDEFLERIQYDYTRRCLAVKDKDCTIERDGFRVGLLCIAVQNGWMERSAAINEVLWYLRQFAVAKTVNGIMPRTFSRTTGDISDEIYGQFGRPYDVVGTAFMAATLLYIVRPFFDLESDGEQEIRLLCNKICDRIDWNFAYNEQEKCFYWFKNGSHAENFDGKALKGEMDETFFMHFLVLGSSGWRHGTEAYAEYTKHIFVDTQYGFKYYSTRPTAKLGYLVQPHIWLDLRNVTDAFCRQNGLGYYESVVHAIHAQIAYAKHNPASYPLYGDVFGFYDTMDPVAGKWIEKGVPKENEIEDGTISVDAAISAIAFCPEAAIKCLRTLYKEYGKQGFYTKQGIATSVNIPTGKISPFFSDNFFPPLNVMLIENYRSGMCWKLATKSPELKKTMKSIGFN